MQEFFLCRDRIIEIAHCFGQGYQYYICPFEGGFRLPSRFYDTKAEAVTDAYQNALWGWVIDHPLPAILIDCSCARRDRAILGRSVSCELSEPTIDPLFLCQICQEGKVKQRLTTNEGTLEAQGELITLPLKKLIVATFHPQERLIQ